MTAAGLTTQYELDGGRVLSANAAGNVTYYLYGLGPIGELTDAWNYSLPDGINTPRQLVDINVNSRPECTGIFTKSAPA